MPRALYMKHIATMFELSGFNSTQSQSNAQTVFQIEQNLASYQLSPEEMEDPFALYNKLDLSGLQQLAPELPWQEFLNGMGYPNATELNILVPDFFSNMSAYISGLDTASQQAYIQWHIINAASPYLSRLVLISSLTP